MRLLNHTSAYFAGILLVIITAWAAVFYYIMLEEIYDSIDDGLDNQKGLVIQKAAIDTALLSKSDFEENDYAIREISRAEALNFQDTYKDTMMYMQNEKSHEPVRLLQTVFLQNGRYYKLQVATSMVEEDDLIKQLFYSILWLYIGLVVTIVIFNNFLLKRIWKPFYDLLQQLRNFRLDKAGPLKTPETTVDEFRMLNETAQKLLKRNIEVYNSQKDFIGNASHEIQTPLAITISKLESLAESQPLSENQLTMIGSALENLERLSRLNKSLLLLTKIENKQFAEETDVNINELVRKLVADFMDQSEYNNLKISIIENDSCVKFLNEDIAGILLTNLLKNAIVHNKPGGFVQVIIDRDALAIENSGIQQSLKQDTLFNRFQNTLSPGSTGLGLAIVKAICDLYHIPISYRFTGVHVFKLQFSK